MTTLGSQGHRRRKLLANSSQRNFKFIGIVGFVSILQSTWEDTLLAS